MQTNVLEDDPKIPPPMADVTEGEPLPPPKVLAVLLEATGDPKILPLVVPPVVLEPKILPDVAELPPGVPKTFPLVPVVATGGKILELVVPGALGVAKMPPEATDVAGSAVEVASVPNPVDCEVVELGAPKILPPLLPNRLPELLTGLLVIEAPKTHPELLTTGGVVAVLADTINGLLDPVPKTLLPENALAVLLGGTVAASFEEPNAGGVSVAPTRGVLELQLTKAVFSIELGVDISNGRATVALLTWGVLLRETEVDFVPAELVGANKEEKLRELDVAVVAVVVCVGENAENLLLLSLDTGVLSSAASEELVACSSVVDDDSNLGREEAAVENTGFTSVP